MKIPYRVIFIIMSKIQFLGILRTSPECFAVLHCWLVNLMPLMAAWKQGTKLLAGL
jgi:hypothetical protein